MPGRCPPDHSFFNSGGERPSLRLRCDGSRLGFGFRLVPLGAVAAASVLKIGRRGGCDDLRQGGGRVARRARRRVGVSGRRGRREGDVPRTRARIGVSQVAWLDVRAGRGRSVRGRCPRTYRRGGAAGSCGDGAYDRPRLRPAREATSATHEPGSSCPRWVPPLHLDRDAVGVLSRVPRASEGARTPAPPRIGCGSAPPDYKLRATFSRRPLPPEGRAADRGRCWKVMR